MIDYKLPWSYTKTHSNNSKDQSPPCILRDSKGDILGVIPNWVIAEHIVTIANVDYTGVPPFNPDTLK